MKNGPVKHLFSKPTGCWHWSHIVVLKPKEDCIYTYAYAFNLAHFTEFQNWANKNHNIRKLFSKPLQVQTIQTVWKQLFCIHFHLWDYKTAEIWIKKANMDHFLPYHTTWESQQQQTMFTHSIKSYTVNQICTFIVLPMPFECKCKYCWDLYKSWQSTKNNFACTLVIMCESWKHLIIMANHVLYNMAFYQ